MIQKPKYWKKPKTFNVGLFTDLILPLQALEIGLLKGKITVAYLKELLPERIKGIKYISNFQNRTFEDLIRELSNYKIISKQINGDYIVNDKGKKLVELFYSSKDYYYEKLTEYMFDTYVIPGWFIDRLWHLNPQGQGQLIIPSPVKDWSIKGKEWSENKWDLELSDITSKTYDRVVFSSKDSFPITKERWLGLVENEYIRLGELKPRIKNNSNNSSALFSPRRRLSQAMKNSTVRYFFSNELNEEKDFLQNREPINTRTYMVWCPRLETMEFLFYTDYNEMVPGRIIFPTAVFREVKNDIDFRVLNKIQNPEGRTLHVYNPNWPDIKDIFITSLVEVYQNYYNKEGIIYISLQDVRDEVCRIMRISARTFENFIELSFEMSLKKEIHYSIALETDIREDQKSSYKSTRRNVVINNTPYSLIAIKKY